MPELRSPYPGVENNGVTSYGGSQMASRFRAVRRCGCGLVAAADLLRYLHRCRPACRTAFWPDGPVDQEEYERLTGLLRKRFLPVFYPTGMTGLGLAFGLQRFFRRYRLPLWARWCVSGKKLWPRVEQQLKADLPVILSIGPNFPFFWRRQKLTLYRRHGEHWYPANATNAHYVMVTGMEGGWLRVSSWGKEYYINQNEFDTYARRYSCYLVSNLLRVEER